MIEEARELLQALTLSENERAELAGSLISSLDATVDQDVDAAWQQEVVRRLHEVQSGKVDLGRGLAEGAYAAAWQVSRCDFILKPFVQLLSQPGARQRG